MNRYAAFLRGMNVGGHRLSNAELCAGFLELGFGEVSAFRASGNVVFAADAPRTGKGEQALQARIEQGLAATLGYAVPTFIRSGEEVTAIAAYQPFPAAQVKASAGKLQVAMLSDPPSDEARREVLALSCDEDALALGERELYWLPCGGILDSALDLKRIGALLGAMTTRTKGTVEQLAGKHFSEG
jgi:uncharacterized protein (DUF1697 family)